MAETPGGILGDTLPRATLVTSPRLGDCKLTSRSNYLDLSGPPVNQRCTFSISTDS